MWLFIFKCFLTAVISVGAANLYRLGGSGKADTKARDIGCALCSVVTLIIWGFLSWWLIAVFFLQFGSLTTYWKKKGTDAKWYNWLFTGLGYSISTLPVALVTGFWLGFAIRLISCTAGVTIFSSNIEDDEKEEKARGLTNNVTLPFLMLPV